MDTSDVSLRRKLGELSKKHEILESKYRHLQEVGAREAERNFDRLRKQAEERAQTSKDLIWNLKTELETQVGLAKRARV
ncbi:unnamed protein product [Parascedosporium putredinis]|uniref:Uncharacterized protein n=1 Tax=Parascedosporium putredinis TaxID=1442378 RepID=A0A9P1HCJ8_9PEZI|nr:unnamed protein product [Parascedosporium putredinis]CAI8004514.1 unnamed protein product [Parascedosporium putredinis]